MANATLSTYDDSAENECLAQDCFKVIRARVSFSMLLKLANVSYRYRMFSFYGENKKARLEISPDPGHMPPPLPKWLQIPYLVPVKGYSLQIVYDGSRVQGIKSTRQGLWLARCAQKANGLRQDLGPRGLQLLQRASLQERDMCNFARD